MKTITRETDQQRWDFAFYLKQKLEAIAGRELTDRELMTVDGREISDDWFWYEPSDERAIAEAEREVRFILDCTVSDIDPPLAAALIFGGKTA